MKRDCSVYLQATIFLGDAGPFTSDIVRVTELTAIEARGLKDALMDDSKLGHEDIKALAPNAEVEFVR